MSERRRSTVTVAAAAAMVSYAPVAAVADEHAATFQALPAHSPARAFGVSADGVFVVGRARTSDDIPYTQAFRWSEKAGLEMLGFLTEESEYSQATAVNADGSVIVGSSRLDTKPYSLRAYRWSAEQGMVNLGSLGNISVAEGVSWAGDIVIGRSSATITSGIKAIEWTDLDMTVLPELGPCSPSYLNHGSRGWGISGDGTVVVGEASTGWGCNFRAVQWVDDRITQLIAGSGSRARAVSADGSVIVGRVSSNVGLYWHIDDGVTHLKAPSSVQFSIDALSVSADGEVVVGTSNGQATIWRDAHPRWIKPMLHGLGVEEVEGWTLEEATGVSADGTVIAGWGTDPQGNERAWRVILPLESASLPGSCKDACGTQSDEGCWCDDGCAVFGDCCEDAHICLNCGSSAGNCCEAHGTDGCNVVSCCQAVCAEQPSCCDDGADGGWDEDCVQLALHHCGGQCRCGSDATGNCCDAQGTSSPACSGGDCCAAVCEADSYCCNVKWDSHCADLAAEVCGMCSAGTGPCCESNDTPGCEDAECTSIICSYDPSCCDDHWSWKCATAASLICPVCSPPPLPDGCGEPGTIDCCNTAGSTTPGCQNEICCALVCYCDPFCCDVAWDQHCADYPPWLLSGCLCGPPANCGAKNLCPHLCTDDEHECCTAHGAPGCPVKPDCEACVCAQDAFCCNVSWDTLCANLATGECANVCCIDVSLDNCGAEEAGDCCTANLTPGCDDTDCCEHVCGCDPYCCDSYWDDICAGSSQGGTCGAAVLCDCPPSNPADLNGDGVVDLNDLYIVLNNWGTCDSCDDCPGDANSDCEVNVDDLLIVLNNWG